MLAKLAKNDIIHEGNSTALEVAASQGHIAAMQELINAVDRKHLISSATEAFLSASPLGQEAVVKLLLEEGVDVICKGPMN